MIGDLINGGFSRNLFEQTNELVNSFGLFGYILEGLFVVLVVISYSVWKNKEISIINIKK
jgi:uncharacterized membrane protein